MKTATEWIRIAEELVNPKGDEERSLVRAIQLDARRQGMRDAAEIVGKDAILQQRPEDWGFLARKKQEILAAADNLREA